MIQIIVIGLIYVMENLKVKNVIIAKQPERSNNLERFLEIVEERKVKVTVAAMGDKVLIEKNLFFYRKIYRMNQNFGINISLYVSMA